MTAQTDRSVPLVLGLPPRALLLATIAGVTLGIAYTLSSLTIWFLLAFALLCRALVRDLAPEERRIVLVILLVATVLRLAVVAGLFLSTDHWSVPFGSLFGDEEYFKRRSLWLRSMALNVDISQADRIYALDEYGDISYLYILAAVQVVVGAAPYGIHLFSIWMYVAGAGLLYRFARAQYGAPQAVLAFALVLFVPTLFFWSVSALRESLHFLLTVIALVGGIELARGPGWRRRRMVWGLAAIGAVLALRGLRVGSAEITTGAVLFGLAGTFLIRRPRVLAIAVVVAVTIGVVAIQRPAVRDFALRKAQANALIHQGHVFTPGLSYKLLEPGFYIDRRPTIMQTMTPKEGARFVVRALVAFVVVPLPWQAQSRLTLAYLPEQMLWYVLVALLPAGIWGGLRRLTPTLVLAAYVVMMSAGIALRSGNIGTLVRHRGLVLPFIICIAVVALWHFLTRAAGERSRQAIADRTMTRAV